MKTILIIIAFLLVTEVIVFLAAFLASEGSSRSFTKQLVTSHLFFYGLYLACILVVLIDTYVLDKIIK